jgi:hypothetical protein
VVISAMFSVVISSRTSSLVSRPAVVLSRQPVISCSALSICWMCFLVRCMVESFAIRWDLLTFTAEAISWLFVANTHSDALISSVVVANVVM